MRTLHRCAVVLLLIGGLPAQATGIVPKSLAGLEGGSSSRFPFGWHRPNRYMAVYESDELPWSGPKLFNGIRFRADWNSGKPTPVKQFMRIEIAMSTSEVQVTNVSATFAENHGIDHTVVFSNVPYSLPAQAQMPESAIAPRQCDVAFPFSRPWFYGLTPGVTADEDPRTLVLDIRTYQSVSGFYFMDNPAGCSIPTSTFGQQGPLCLTSQQSRLTLDSSTAVIAGGQINYTVSGLNTAYPCLVLVALSDQGKMFGNPVPVSLDIIAALANPNPRFPITAPDCFLNIEPIMSLPAVIQGSVGIAKLSLPADRGLVGQSFFAQALSNDLGANSFQFTSSLGLKTTVCGPSGVTRIMELNSAAALIGTVSGGSALVFEVY